MIFIIIIIVSKKIAETFNILGKFESESDTKDKKFWDEINEFKLPLGDIFDESK